MSLTKIAAVIVLVCALGWASGQLGAQDNAAREGLAVANAAREARDRTEIEALMWRYTRALDTYNPEAYASAYTPDGQFSAGPNATKGREALHKMVADLKERRAASIAKGEPQQPMYHMTMNSKLTFVDKDHARLEAYWQTVFGAAGQNVPVRVAAAGRSVDDLVRVNGQWLIQSRNVAPQN
jgi:uncharacterized protein (TIGR02246 family)